MIMRIFVENLPGATKPEDLMNLFAPYGNVMDVNIATDRQNLKPTGCGSVTMVTPEGARAAIQALHGKQIGARTLGVSEVHPQNFRSNGVQEPPNPPAQHHSLFPTSTKNEIIPTTRNWNDQKNKITGQSVSFDNSCGRLSNVGQN